VINPGGQLHQARRGPAQPRAALYGATTERATAPNVAMTSKGTTMDIGAFAFVIN
jgi:hypothetical protein